MASRQELLTREAYLCALTGDGCLNRDIFGLTNLAICILVRWYDEHNKVYSLSAVPIAVMRCTGEGQLCYKFLAKKASKHFEARMCVPLRVDRAIFDDTAARQQRYTRSWRDRK